MLFCKAECGVEGRVATFKAGAAAHQVVVMPGASGEVLAAARSNRAHTPRKAVRCVIGDPKAKVCGEGVSSVRARPNWTVPVGHLAGKHSAVDHWILCMRASAPSLQWSLLIPVCCGGGTGHEVEPYPLTVYKLPSVCGPVTNRVCAPERSQQGSQQVGLFVDGGCKLGVASW